MIEIYAVEGWSTVLQHRLQPAGGETRDDQIGPLTVRLNSRGVHPTGLCIAAMRHFRTLYTVDFHPGGAGESVGRLRPLRDRILRKAHD